MTNRKTTKRALLGSVLALVLCFAMLLGSTYAWFTDVDQSAKSAVITAGVLDVELQTYTDNGWADAENVILFENPVRNDGTLTYYWEPGYTAWEALKVSNNGNLALKWTAKIDAVDGAALGDLANVIDVYFIEYTEQEFDDAVRDGSINRTSNEWNHAGTLATFIDNTNNGGVTSGDIARGEGAEIIVVSLKMQTTAGNEYMKKTIPAFQVTILATQDTVESDAFGTEYDDAATYPEYNKPTSN